jgi:hypothetical protein
MSPTRSSKRQTCCPTHRMSFASTICAHRAIRPSCVHCAADAAAFSDFDAKGCASAVVGTAGKLTLCLLLHCCLLLLHRRGLTSSTSSTCIAPAAISADAPTAASATAATLSSAMPVDFQVQPILHPYGLSTQRMSPLSMCTHMRVKLLAVRLCRWIDARCCCQCPRIDGSRFLLPSDSRIVRV